MGIRLVDKCLGSGTDVITGIRLVDKCFENETDIIVGLHEIGLQMSWE